MSEIKKTKFIIFAVASLMLSTIFMITLILGFDIYLHKKFDKMAVLNVWGYRGPVVKQKKPGDQRIVMSGGSTVFGYGAKPNETFPAFLESRLNGQKQIANQVPISVVNLGLIFPRFGNHPRLHYINLGRAIDLKDRTLAYDHMHLTAHGSELIAEALKQPLIEILSN